MSVFVLAAAFVCCGIIPMFLRMNLRDYFGMQSDGDVGVTVDFENRGSAGKYIEGKPYLAYETAASLNPSIWYDEPSGMLITTMAEETETLAFSGGTTPGKEAGFLDGTLYIALDYLLKVSDLEADVFENPHHVHIRTLGSYESASLNGSCAVRAAPSLRKRVIADGRKGDVVSILDDGVKKGWTRVITEDGLVGYVRSRRLSEAAAVETGIGKDPAKIFAGNRLDETVSMVFHQTDTQASNDAFDPVSLGMEGINVIAPTWYYLDSTDGDVRDLSSGSYVEKAHAAGLRVFAVLNDFDGNISSPEETAAFLRDYDARSRAIRQIAESLEKCGADGLNLDMELARSAEPGTFIQFIRELGVEMRRGGYVFSIDDPVPTYTAWMDRAEQARNADYIVVMCYDEHTASSLEAGSVASMPFVEKGIADTLQEVPQDKLIAAFPFFTRIWTSGADGSGLSCSSLGMDAAQEAVNEYGMTVVWDDETGQQYAEAQEGSTLRQIWLEDPDTAGRRIDMAVQAGCAGCAFWKLGFQSDSVWGIISEKLRG